MRQQPPTNATALPLIRDDHGEVGLSGRVADIAGDTKVFLASIQGDRCCEGELVNVLGRGKRHASRWPYRGSEETLVTGFECQFTQQLCLDGQIVDVHVPDGYGMGGQQIPGRRQGCVIEGGSGDHWQRLRWCSLSRRTVLADKPLERQACAL